MTQDIGKKLGLHRLVDEPALKEHAVLSEQARAKDDAAVRNLLVAEYSTEDREADFARYLESREFASILHLLELFGIGKEARICEIGGGPGWLSWALHRSGYTHVDLLEPSDEFVTGTGYLRSRSDAANIRIWNDIPSWYEDAGEYALILTRNCVHHFQGIAAIAAMIRTKVEAGGAWLMLKEWFAEEASELYRKLASHPYSQKYGLYEFPYPVHHYVESLEMVGFDLQAVVPSHYRGNALFGNESSPSRVSSLISASCDRALLHFPKATTWAFSLEGLVRRPLLRLRPSLPQFFRQPQALFFKRREIDL